MSPALPVIDAPTLGAEGAFSYECRRCRRCCSDKTIRVNPYEVYRLSRRVGTSTTEFLARYTIEGGTELARRADGSCVFLGEQGCGVHQDRPLVCRLYPLGRHVRDGEPDRFHTLEGHPESEGVFGSAGTVRDYLESQGAAPFMRGADDYLETLARLLDVLRRVPNARPAAVLEGDVAHWLDIDAVLAREGGAPPQDAEEASRRHRDALHAWSTSLLTSMGDQ